MNIVTEPDPLALLLADGVIEGVHSRLKSGKEADLWLVSHAGETVAAKVYKARQLRSFRNNTGYKEGRQVRDTRTQRAMSRGSRFGQAAAEDAWKAKEAEALHTLHAAGVRVPRPILFYEGVLLMELVVDGEGRPAPRLVETRVPRDEAAGLYADLRAQAVRMLRCDIIHGDLSPYNVLLGHRGPEIIDFPQVVGAAHNSQAETYFRRDLENLRTFFASVDSSLRGAVNDAREIWRAYVRRELTPDFVPTGRAAPSAQQKHQVTEPGQHHHARPNEVAPHQHDRSHRGHRATASGRSPPAPESRGLNGKSHGSHQPTRQHRARGASPGPEVIRIERPRLSPAGNGATVQRLPLPHDGASPGEKQPEGMPGSRRRRRRRRSS